MEPEVPLHKGDVLTRLLGGGSWYLLEDPSKYKYYAGHSEYLIAKARNMNSGAEQLLWFSSRWQEHWRLDTDDFDYWAAEIRREHGII